ncbi:hypothetical protein ABD440_08245, partial [Chromobacterium piscinae]|uniref:hypothetical protein n=1 Tax=Chromobacterium piscinae TaxID=686831 RepID=UPI0031FC113C
ATEHADANPPQPRANHDRKWICRLASLQPAKQAHENKQEERGEAPEEPFKQPTPPEKGN